MSRLLIQNCIPTFLKESGYFFSLFFFMALTISCQHTPINKTDSVNSNPENEKIQAYISEQILRVRTGVMSSKDKFLDCYHSNHETQEGFAVFYFMLSKQGSVSQLKLTQSNFTRVEFIKCLTKELNKTIFPTDSLSSAIQADSVPIIVPLEFRIIDGKLNMISN